MGKITLAALAILLSACTSASIKPRGEPLPVSAFPPAQHRGAALPSAPPAASRLIVDGQPVLPPGPGQQTAPPASLPAVPAAPSPPAPVNTGICDASGCWSTSGQRYEGGTGNVLLGPGGRSCHLLNGVMQCF